MAYSGTFVTAGTGRGLVVATGVETEIGRIHQLVGEAEGVTTPLTRRLSAFSRWLTIVINVLAGLTLAVGVLRGEGIAEMVTAAVALAVGAIPEGLPAAVTITLAIGVSRMARCHAIIRRLPAAETLGSTTVICTDKTGTLTQNRMTVQYVFAHGLVHQIEDADPDHVGPCLTAGTLCNNADIEFDDAGALTSVGDPTEVALLVGAFTAGEAAAGEEATWPRIAGAFGLFEWSSSQGASLDHARTVAVNAFVAMEIGYLFNCRALNRSLLSVGLFTNRLLLAGVAGTIALQLAFTYLPIMNAAFQSAPLTWSDWVAVVALGVAIYLVVGTEKWISARVNRRAGQPDESSPHLDRPRLPGEVPRC